jgi:hypothetical protein
MHALGFGTLFDANGLTGVTNFFGEINYTYNGFALREYRNAAGNPFATFIPLSQNDGGGHWSAFDPYFFQPDEGLIEIMVPFAAPPGFEEFISRATWGAFADMGYLVTGINAPGIPPHEVPEPASAFLLSIAGLILVTRRRRRSV